MSDGAPKDVVFISHDSRDAAIAEAFADLLKRATAGAIGAFRSSDISGEHGIPAGKEFFQVILRGIDSASDVVCLLTPRSLERPWILFEAGYAKGKPKKHVYGLLLGGVSMRDIAGSPFAPFQNCPGDVEHLVGVVMQLAKRVPRCEPDPAFVTAKAKEFLAVVQSLQPAAEVGNPRLLHHVSLPVRDLASSVEFYSTAIGLRERPRPSLNFRKDGAWFEFPSGQQLHLLLNPQGTFRNAQTIDYNDCHFAVRVPDLAAAHKRIRVKYPIAVNQDITFESYPHFYVLDPDWHVIEFNGDQIVERTSMPGV
jgi:catechol 2,3-dioxygenase-like lactoylglutathione lyase family enzyme